MNLMRRRFGKAFRPSFQARRLLLQILKFNHLERLIGISGFQVRLFIEISEG